MAVKGGEPRIWPAPGKLNLMLRILGRRDDGYHLLQTVFQFVDLADELRFEVRPDALVRRPSQSEVAQEDDLVVRAARILQAETGISQGVDIWLDKRLPMGGGLGGGSSDAATTLVALNQLWGTGLDTDALAALGLRLGADVPVFVRGFAAWGEGVGDQLTPIELPTPWYLVLTPDCHVSTAAVFSDPDLTRDSPRIKIADFLAGGRANDCLPVVRRRYAEVARALDWLDLHGQARLTGTGACVFSEFASKAEALAIERQLPTGLKGFVCRGLNQSPLLDRT